MKVDELPEPSNPGTIFEQKAEKAELDAQKFRIQAAEQRAFMDSFENMALMLAHISEQMNAFVQAIDAPKVVERDAAGKATGIRS